MAYLGAVVLTVRSHQSTMHSLLSELESQYGLRIKNLIDENEKIPSKSTPARNGLRVSLSSNVLFSAARYSNRSRMALSHEPIFHETNDFTGKKWNPVLSYELERSQETQTRISRTDGGLVFARQMHGRSNRRFHRREVW